MTTEHCSSDEHRPSDEHGLSTLVHWMLHDRPRLRREINRPSVQADALQRLLALAVGTLFVYGLIMWAAYHVTGTHSSVFGPRDGSSLGPAAVAIAYPVGLVGALGICLPSYYFYTLQCGFVPSLRRIVINTIAGQAATGMYLFGIVPIYVAIMLGVSVISSGVDTPVLCAIGLLLPAVAGLHGVREIYEGFLQHRADRGEQEGGRGPYAAVVLAALSAGLYVVVTPVLVYRLLGFFGALGV